MKRESDLQMKNVEGKPEGKGDSKKAIFFLLAKSKRIQISNGRGNAAKFL